MELRFWIRTATALVAAAAIAPAPAQPSQAALQARPLRLVVPFAAGGAQDVIARTIGDKLAQRLGVTVVVENRAGAGGAIAADLVAKAPPDGNTLLLASGGAISIVPHLNPKLPYDSQRDFAPVALLADTPMTLAVRAESPYRSVADVLHDARAKPGQIAYASTGQGTVSHLTGELLAQAAGVKLLHVPYKGAAPAISDLLGGQVPLMVTSVASIEPMVSEGKARVLLTFTRARVASLKNPPTGAEAGLPGLEVPVWAGVLAPARTPTERLDALAAEIVAACTLPDTQARFVTLGAVSSCAGRAELGRIVAEDFARWGKVIRQAGIKSE